MQALIVLIFASYWPAVLNLLTDQRGIAPAMARALRLLPDESGWQPQPANGLLGPRFGRSSPLGRWGALGCRDEGNKLSHGQQHDLDLAKLKSRTELMGNEVAGPLRRNGWKTEDSLKMPLGGSVFIVGQVGANSDSVEQQQYKVTGSTGVGATLPAGGEIQVRRVRSVTNYDPDDLMLIREQAKSSVEFTLRWKLPGDLKLEYTGEAVQQLLEHDLRKQDLRLAFPLTSSGQFHIGAKYHSAEPGLPTT